ncbi:MAG: hypothetical protein J6Y48_15750 [Clostridia bacterium]|nr:hypothetical protein [Clostridia bacterium]
MADQEFLASFAVELDETGIARLQSVLAENTALADSLSAAFSVASASLHTFAEDLGLLPDFSGRGIVTESLKGLGGLSLGLDLSQAFTDYERFTALMKQPVSLKANAAGITSAARTALNSVRSLFAAPVTLHVKAEQEGGGADPGAGPPVKMSAGGRFSRPTEVQVAEDGDAEYIIPVKKEERAVPLLRRLMAELSPAAREKLTNSESAIAVTQIKDLDSCRMGVMNRAEARMTPQQFRIGGEGGMRPGIIGSVITGSPAAGQAVNVITRDARTVSAPVNIQVHAQGTDAKQVGQSLYSMTERYLLRTLESAFS